MQVIDRIEMHITGDGEPELRAAPRKAKAGRLDPFFQQGGLDGACGVYALTMLLALHGQKVEDKLDKVLTRLLVDHVVRETRERGRSVKQIMGDIPIGVLLGEGTDADLWKDLIGLLAPTWRLEEVTPPPGTRKRRSFSTDESLVEVRGLLDDGVPLLAELNWRDGGHAVVIVGYSAADPAGPPDRLLLLDPDATAPRVCPWNAILERKNAGKGRSNFCWANVDRVPFSDRAYISGLHRLRRASTRKAETR